MLDRQHQGQLIAGIGHHLQQLTKLRWKLAADDRKIHLAIGNAPAGAAGAVHLQLHRHFGILLAKQPNHSRH